MKPLSGHIWHGLGRGPQPDVVMHVAWPAVEPLAPVEAHLCECSECGLVLARAELADGEVRRAYGFDLDSLALMGSAPVCKPLVMGGAS